MLRCLHYLAVCAGSSLVVLTAAAPRDAACPGRPWRRCARYKQANLPIDQRVADLLARMTLEEKPRR